MQYFIDSCRDGGRWRNSKWNSTSSPSRWKWNTVRLSAANEWGSAHKSLNCNWNGQWVAEGKRQLELHSVTMPIDAEDINEIDKRQVDCVTWSLNTDGPSDRWFRLRSPSPHTTKWTQIFGNRNRFARPQERQRDEWMKLLTWAARDKVWHSTKKERNMSSCYITSACWMFSFLFCRIECQPNEEVQAICDKQIIQSTSLSLAPAPAS